MNIDTILSNDAQIVEGECPDGSSLSSCFSLKLRFRPGHTTEIGKPWISYKATCPECGQTSRAFDRKTSLSKWLNHHRSHYPAFERLTTEKFAFKMSTELRDLFATYVKVQRDGKLNAGLKASVNDPSLDVTQLQREKLKEFLKIVEQSGFYKEDRTKESPRKQPAVKTDAKPVKTLKRRKLPEKTLPTETHPTPKSEIRSYDSKSLPRMAFSFEPLKQPTYLGQAHSLCGANLTDSVTCHQREQSLAHFQQLLLRHAASNVTSYGSEQRPSHGNTFKTSQSTSCRQEKGNVPN